MAYTKIIPIKTGSHLNQLIDYIQNDLKTDGKIFISSYMCDTENTAVQFEDVRSIAIKKGNNIAHHICQSFSPEDNITPQKALEIGQELMKRFYPNHQYVIATHIDRGHIHNHIVCNSVDMVKHKKIHSNLKSLKKLRDESDNLCRENGLSVIEPEQQNIRERLKENIDKAVNKYSDFESFLGFMQSQGYKIKRGKHLYFKDKDSKNFINTRTFGTAYTEINLKRKIINGKDITNKKFHIYDDKIVKMSYRKRLRYCIDEALKTAKNYDEFLEYLKSADYEIKFGKHLAFRHITGQRFIRTENLGLEYSEDMLKLKFSDYEKYLEVKDFISKGSVKKITESDTDYKNRYIESKNVNIEISMLNYLHENGIKNYDELISEIEKLRKQEDINIKNITNIDIQIEEKKSILKVIRQYWQYKPYYSEYLKIKSLTEKEQYVSEHKTELDRYNNAMTILNYSRTADGTIPQSTKLNIEIERLEKLKSNIIARNNKVKVKISSCENIKATAENILTEKQTSKEKNNDKICKNELNR